MSQLMMNVLVTLSLPAMAGEGHKIVRLDLRFPEKVCAKGQTLERLKLAYDRLRSQPLGDIDFVLSDVNFKFERRFTNYSGDISGRMLGALYACDAVLGTKSAMVDKLIAAFKRYQKPDGHFGADQNLDKEVNQLRDMALLWGNGRLLLAMAQRLARKPDPALEAMARKLGDYCIATRKYYGKEENFKGVGGIKASGFTTCYPSLIDGLAALGEVTGETKYVDEARFISRLSLIDRGFKDHHSHGRLTAYRGMLDVDRVRKSDEFNLPLSTGRVTILEKYMAPTGGIDEYFTLSRNGDEGCSEADWLRVNFFTWWATSETGALDVVEHVLRNHLYATQFSNGGFGHWRFRRLRDGKDAFDYGGITNSGSDSYWCCSMHGTQVLADVARWGVVADRERIYVTWLAEVESTIKPEGQKTPITVTTARKGTAAWTVTIKATKKTQATLALRVPRSEGGITVDGKQIRGRGSWADFTGAGGWVNVKREWSGTTTLKVELPTAIRLEKPYESTPKGSGVVCVLAGPDLYCLPDVSLPEGFIPTDAVPRIAMAAKTPKGGKIPVIVEADGKKPQRATLIPTASRGGTGARWLFRVRRVSQEAFKTLAEKARRAPKRGTPIELEFGIDGECEVYLNGKLVTRHRGWVEGPQLTVHTTRTSNVVAIKAKSSAKRPGVIGLIRAKGRCLATNAKDWSVVRVGDKVPNAWLTDADKGSTADARVVDLGGLGIPPWHHTPGEFHRTKARWIWGEGKSDPSKGWWLFRIQLDLPAR